MQRVLIILIVSFLFLACNSDSECRQERYVAMGVELHQTKFDAIEETYVTSIYTPDSITIYGVGNDSILYDRQQISAFYLPLRKTENSSEYVLCTNGKYDTITVFHENIDNYLSMECGCLVFAHLDSVNITNHRLDSAIIRIPEVMNIRAKHLELYYKAD